MSFLSASARSLAKANSSAKLMSLADAVDVRHNAIAQSDVAASRNMLKLPKGKEVVRDFAIILDEEHDETFAILKQLRISGIPCHRFHVPAGTESWQVLAGFRYPTPPSNIGIRREIDDWRGKSRHALADVEPWHVLTRIGTVFKDPPIFSEAQDFQSKRGRNVTDGTNGRTTPFRSLSEANPQIKVGRSRRSRTPKKELNGP